MCSYTHNIKLHHILDIHKIFKYYVYGYMETTQMADMVLVTETSHKDKIITVWTEIEKPSWGSVLRHSK
jgi:hypothetical protein